MHPIPATIGRYKVLRELGRGAMGVVYLAADPVIGRQVAIKVLWPAAGPAEGERLADEARVSGRLTHPHIVQTFDAGEDDGHPFVVMQYIEGQTLARVLTDPERPTLDTKLRWMGELCDGLQYAHQARVIHRDIKPSNLLIDSGGGLRILDFGIAKILSTSQASFSSVGTPAYMAPEQYSRAPVDARTDVFSVGLVLFEVVSHRRALHGDSPAQILGQVMMGDMPRLAAVVPGVDPELAAICDRATAREPAHRFQTARELGEALATVRTRAASVRHAPVPAAPEPAAPAPAAPPPTAATVPSGEKPIAVPRSEPAAAPAAAIAPAPAAAPLSSPPDPPRKAAAWWTAATTTRWRFTLPAAAVSSILVALLVFGPQRSAAPTPSPGPVASPPMQASEPPAVAAAKPPAPIAPGPARPDSMQTSAATAAVAPGATPATPPPAPALGRLRLSADLPGATFTTEIRGVTKTLSSSEPNVLPPGAYRIRAAYVDGDQSMGAAGQSAYRFETVDVAAGKTTTTEFTLGVPLWRNRFEQALRKPAGQRAAILERSHQRLKELNGIAPGDDERYAKAAAEQQLVTLVKGDFVFDEGLPGFLQFTKVDVRVEGKADPIVLVGGPANTAELLRGRHAFTAEVNLHARDYQGPPGRTLTCSGAFSVPGGPVPLPLKVDVIARLEPAPTGQNAGRKAFVECQIGGSTPLRPNPIPHAALSVRVNGNGAGVAGATVTAQPPDGAPSKHVTDRDGVADFGEMSPGRYDVTVNVAGFRHAPAVVDLQAGTPKRLLVNLRRADRSDTTSDDGRFAFRVPAGRYDVRLECPGYKAIVYSRVKISEAFGVQFDVRLERGSETETVAPKGGRGVAGGGTIAGTVTNSRGEPVRDVLILAVAVP